MTDNNLPNTDLKSGAEQDYGQFADDVIERPLVRTKTRSLNRRGSMDPGLLSWLEELYPYEESFPKMMSTVASSWLPLRRSYRQSHSGMCARITNTMM